MIESLVRVKKSKRAKRIALRLDPVERVMHLVVPANMSLKRAYQFAQTHEEWVKETLAKLPKPVEYQNGMILPIFGDEMKLCIQNREVIKRTKIDYAPGIMTVTTNLEDPSLRITHHLKNLAKKGLAEMASEKADEIGQTISSIAVRDTKSRWGSCSHDKSIAFSWRLIFAPYAAIDYVVAHEVAHLVHMDHSKEFWSLCRSLSHDFVEGKYWMQNHGNELMRYGKSGTTTMDDA
ncbi:MAG: DUF45 domain-containing protein [Alphaproteobacteria bacterium]|nr:DUF45 domain-containing protein [Alphaproteobacteria bacterium]